MNTDHETCARSFVAAANGERATYRGPLVAVECLDLSHVVTFDPSTGDAVLWRVGYSQRRTHLRYRRLAPVKVRALHLDGASWRERRDAAKSAHLS